MGRCSGGSSWRLAVVVNFIVYAGLTAAAPEPLPLTHISFHGALDLSPGQKLRGRLPGTRNHPGDLAATTKQESQSSTPQQRQRGGRRAAKHRRILLQYGSDNGVSPTVVPISPSPPTGSLTYLGGDANGVAAASTLAYGAVVKSPTQGLCVGNGVAVHIVSGGILWVYNASSSEPQVLARHSLSGFLGSASVFTVQCLYDPETKAFFLLGSDAKTGKILLAGSSTLDPNKSCPFTLGPGRVNNSSSIAQSPAMAVNEEAICISYKHLSRPTASTSYQSLGPELVCVNKGRVLGCRQPLYSETHAGLSVNMDGCSGPPTLCVSKPLQRITPAVTQAGSSPPAHVIYVVGRTQMHTVLVTINTTLALRGRDSSGALQASVVALEGDSLKDVGQPVLPNGLSLHLESEREAMVFAAGRLYYARNVDASPSRGDKAIHFAILKPFAAANTATVVQEGVLAVSAGGSLFSPAFSVAPDGTAILGVSFTNQSTLLSLGALTLPSKGGQDNGTLFLLHQGQELQPACAADPAVMRCNWVSHSAAAYDPDQQSVWLASTLAVLPSNYDNNWGTALARLPLPIQGAPTDASAAAPPPLLGSGMPGVTASPGRAGGMSDGMRVGLIVGLVVGNLAVFVLLLVSLYWWLLEKKRVQSPSDPPP